MLDAIWQTLTTYKIVAGPRPGIATEDSPWYVKALLALSGWVAAFFLIGFIGFVFAFVIQHAFASILLGAVLLAVAYCLLRKPGNDFFSHLALALSLTGQGLIVWGILEPLHGSPNTCALIIGILEILLTAIMPSFIHRVFSSFAASCALYVGFAFIGSDNFFFSPLTEALIVAILALLMSWFWLHEFRFPKKIAALSATAYGLTFALLCLKSSAIFGDHTRSRLISDQDLPHLTYAWFGEALLVVVLMWVVTQILSNLKNVPARVNQVAIAGTLLLGLVSLKAPGIAIGIMITLLGFYNGNQVLRALGIFALLGYISRYYYFLDATLASKAGVLLLVGAVLLSLRFLLLRIAQVDLSKKGGR